MRVDGQSDVWPGPPSGPPPRNRRECEAAWMLVLCCEWCFKDTGKALRSFLEFHVTEMGGVFRCFKKASQFLNWESKVTKPYFLITDWRTAKPCIETAYNQAMFTVVFCIDGRQERKAQRWVSSLRTNGGPIYISADANLEPPISCLLAKAIQHQQVKDGMQASLKESKKALSTLEAPQHKDDGVQVHLCSNQIQLSDVHVPHELQMNPNQTASDTYSVYAAACSEPAMHDLLDMVEDVWKSLQSPEQVEHALKQAMPLCYED